VTIFGGVFALEPRREIARTTTTQLAAALSRFPGDRPALHSGPGYALAYLDLKLLPGEGHVVDENGAASFVAGDLLCTPRSSASRTDDLRSLHERWLHDDDSLLPTARGSFAVAQIDPRSSTLRLAVDVLAGRSLYVAFADGLLYFATALRIVEQLSELKKRVDVRGLLETSAFGFPLSIRTQYEGVELLDGCETIRVDRAQGLRRTKYWHWNDLRPHGESAEELPRLLHARFQEAVRWRLGHERTVLSSFSGGLDSRCVTASLLGAGANVLTMNIAPEGSLDLVLGRYAAKRLQTRHFEFTAGSADGVNKGIVDGHRAWLASLKPDERPDFPASVWTGNGGSVGMGHIYIDAKMVGLMQHGRRAEAVRTYLARNGIGLSPRVFRRPLRSTVELCCIDGVLEQLHQLESFDEGRRLHLFLMMNDQRRHLTDHFEDIDLNRLEMINPFFDTEFLRLVLASPVEPFLSHRLYNAWLKQFPFAIDSMPWQAYADHEPCPLPVPAGLRNQWESGYYNDATLKAVRAGLLDRSRRALSSEHFPAGLLRGSALRIAWWLTRTGLGDYSYLLKLASAWTDYASRADAGATAGGPSRRSALA
jgi:hypothetical protein